MLNMGKKLFLLVNLLLFAAVIQAAPISKSEAQKKAQQFISGKIAAARGTSTPDLQLATADGDNYYVFNVTGQQGFVIVSGDDRAPAILGYSDEGQFDATNIPSNMKAWLQGYADEIQELKNTPEVAGARSAARVPERDWAAIDPLIQTKWGQDAPYNNAVNPNVTGCVATAMAQIMYYHKWPFGATTAIPGYGNRSGLSTTTFDWNNMKLVYTGSESDDANNAVATLMQYCGYSVQMNYGTGASEADSRLAVNAFKSYFNYDHNVRYTERAYYGIDEWESIIYEELANDRPVMYGGSTVGGSGHEFVCDGYDGNGLFHFNWGWDGNYNGFFVLWSANPKGSGIGGSNTADGYSSVQSAIVGIQKPTEGSAIEEQKKLTVKELRVYENQLVYSRNSVSENFSIDVCSVVGNATSETFDVSIGFGLYRDGKGSVIYQAGGGSCSPGSYYFKNGNSYTFVNLEFGSGKTGTYYIVPISKETMSDTWLKDGMSDQYYIEATMTDTELTLCVAPVVDLEVTNVVYTRNKMAGILQEVKATIMNHGSEYNGKLYLVMNSNSGYSSAEQVALRAGQETDVYFHYTPGSAGTDTWHIGTGTSSSTWLQGGTGTQEIVAYEAYNNIDLDLRLVIHNKTKEQYIFGNNVSFTVIAKNTSEQVYAGRVGYIFDNSIWTYSSQILPGDSVSYDYSENVELGDEFQLAAVQEWGNSWRYDMHDYVAAEGIEATLSDGTTDMLLASETIVVPNDVTSIDLRGITTYPTINTNNQPNCLLVVDNKSSLNGKNVIKGTTAANVELTDGSSFASPINFTATEISYERSFTKGTDGEGGGWTTIILPFDVEAIEVDDEPEPKPVDWFHSSTDTKKNFWLRELVSDGEGSVTFGYVSELKANTPYIIAVPGNKWGTEWNLIGKTLKFIGKSNANIEKDAETEKDGDHYSFVGTTVRQQLEDVYALNEEGSTFEYGNAMIAPFRAYFTPLGGSNPSRLIIRSEDGKTTAIGQLPAEIATPDGIYTLDGRKVKGNLKKGVYIVNGKKMIK